MLPEVSEAERLHSHLLAERIHSALAASGGWLSFERFMELALYEPGLGYYSAGSIKLGAAGDFVTAPEVSDLFGRCLARQCAQVLAETGGEIMELGAGTGRMAAALLVELAALRVPFERYAILEVSADLAARQRERLARLPGALRERVVWLDRLPQRPIRGVILANEVADALPCRRVRWQDDSLLELGVAATQMPPGFRDQTASADEALRRAWSEITDSLPAALPDGYTSELCLRVTPWILSLARSLQRGLMLLCDYGLPRRHYYHPQRVSGTLRCHFRQRAHDDPYINIGLQDITAWVDFTRVAQAGLEAGLEVRGFCTQAAALLGLGIETLVAQADGDRARVQVAGEARRLMMPEEMGEAFKMLALTRDFDAPLPAFAVQDLRDLL
jgi:SAM-dependent MidA family methyltransferase